MTELNQLRAILPEILKHEGGYSFDADDPGGETYMGIARKYHKKWEGWNFIDAYKVNNTLKRNDFIISPELMGLVAAFYFERFYKPLNISGLDLRIQLNIFDFAVNAGKVRAVKLTQKIVGVTQDGKCGPITKQAIDSFKGDFAGLYKQSRVDFYTTLANRKPKLRKFLKGWINRVNNLKIEL